MSSLRWERDGSKTTVRSATAEELAAESTSAALRRVEQERDEALLSIRAYVDTVRAYVDSTSKLIAERDEAVANFKRLQVLAREDFEKCTTVIKQAGDDRDLARAELASARTELDAVRAARDTLDRARNWVVARDDGYTCDWCGQGIHRGEAYDPTHGVDEYRHIHCPTEPRSSSA